MRLCLIQNRRNYKRCKVKKMFRWILLIGALLGLVSGALNCLSFQDTLTGMRSVATGAPGTFVMAKDNLFVLAWPAGEDAWAFACLTKNGEPARELTQYVKGMRLDTFSMAKFMADLETDGFQRVSERTLPPTLLAAIHSIMSYIAMVGVRSLPELFIVPAVILQPYATPTGVSQ